PGAKPPDEFRLTRLPGSDRHAAPYRGPVHQPAQGERIVEIRLVLHGDVVPHEEVAGAPGMFVAELRLDDMGADLREEGGALGIRQAYDVRRVGLVDEEALAPGHRMRA